MTTAASAPEQQRGFGQLLRERNFRLFWFGETVSQIGNRMAAIAVPLLAVAVLRASPFTVGLLTTLQWLPWLLFSLPAGAWLDRVSRRKAMIGCDVIAAVLYGSIPVAGWLGVRSVGQLMVVVFLAGTASVVFETAYQAQLPDLLTAEMLTEGNAALQASANITLVGGPSLGGYVAEALGAASALALNAVSFLVSALCLRAVDRAVMAPPARRPRHDLRSDMRDGIRFVATDPYLRPMTLWSAASNFGLTGYTALMMIFLVRVVRVSPAVIGLMVTAAGTGIVAGSVLAAAVGRRFGTARGFLLEVFVTSPFILLIPLTAPGPRLVFFVAGWMVFGCGISVSNVLVGVFRQTYPPPRMRARVTATVRVLINGAYPVGAVLGGALGAWLGIRNGLWVMLSAAVLGSGFLLSPPLWRCRDFPPSRQFPAGA